MQEEADADPVVNVEDEIEGEDSEDLLAKASEGEEVAGKVSHKHFSYCPGVIACIRTGAKFLRLIICICDGIDYYLSRKSMMMRSHSWLPLRKCVQLHELALPPQVTLGIKPLWSINHKK